MVFSRIRLSILLFAFIVIYLPQTFAQDGKPFEVVGSETFHIVANSNNKTYEIQIGMPDNYSPEMCSSMATVYVTDGNWIFASAVSSAKYLRLSNSAPPILTVGIGYPVDDDKISRKRRTEDLVPVELNPERAYSKTLDTVSGSGEADSFAIFLRDQVMPFVETRYFKTKEVIYSGYSFGGTFGLYVLFKHTDMFTRYMIGSPDQNFNNKILMDLEREYAKNHDDLDKHVYMATGEDEFDDTVPGLFNMGFALQNRRYQSLKLQFELIEDVDHLEFIIPFYPMALLKIFSDITPKRNIQPE